MVMRRWFAFSALLLLTSCSLVLDFKSESDLPCPCLPDYVCLQGTNRCAKMGSVDDFKSCDLDAERPNDLCKPNSICVNLKDRGLRCLPHCVPTSYSTEQSGLRLKNECAETTTCWPMDQGGGVCDMGECSELPNNCDPPRQCSTFNGAGICFTPCDIFANNACGGATETCHPIGGTNHTACLPVGTLGYGQNCSDTEACAKTDNSGRAMICDRPQGSTDALRCWTICKDNSMCLTGQTCQFSRAMIDSFGDNLSLCIAAM